MIHGIAFNNSDPWIMGALPLVIQSPGGLTQPVPMGRIKAKNEVKRSDPGGRTVRKEMVSGLKDRDSGKFFCH